MERVEPIRDKKKLDAIKKILKGSNLRDYCLFTLGINCGLRVSDLLKLKLSDVIDEKGKVHDRIMTREKKTGKWTTLPIPPNSKKALEEYLNTKEIGSLDEPLFKSRKGDGPIQRAQAWRVINAATQAVGIRDNIGTHTMRKTFGYHAYKSGASIEVLQKIFNHHSQSVTMRYIGITQDEMDDVYYSVNL